MFSMCGQANRASETHAVTFESRYPRYPLNYDILVFCQKPGYQVFKVILSNRSRLTFATRSNRCSSCANISQARTNSRTNQAPFAAGGSVSSPPSRNARYPVKQVYSSMSRIPDMFSHVSYAIFWCKVGSASGLLYVVLSDKSWTNVDQAQLQLNSKNVQSGQTQIIELSYKRLGCYKYGYNIKLHLPDASVQLQTTETFCMAYQQCIPPLSSPRQCGMVLSLLEVEISTEMCIHCCAYFGEYFTT